MATMVAAKYLVALLRASVHKRDLDTGTKLHAKILSKGLLQENIFLSNTLMNMYAKCGATAKAEQVFNEIRAPDIVSWTTLIAGHCDNLNAEEALCCFKKLQQTGLSPDAVTFSCILKACARAGAADIGEALHVEMVRRHLLDHDTMLGTALVDMYSKCGEMERAQHVFDELPAHDVVAWTVLIAGYCEQRHSVEGIKCFEAMTREGISPDGMTFSWILKACGNMKAVEEGEGVHAELVKIGCLRKDNVLASALVDMYTKCDALVKAQQVFDELAVRDKVSWTTLILGYSENFFGKEALQCFEQMQHEGISPDAVTFACVLKACGSIKAVDKGRALHAEIVKSAMSRENAMLGCALVDMYSKFGELGEAQQVFDELSSRDLLLSNLLIAAYSQQGLGEEALSYFEQMKHDNITPDGVTFSCILKACGTLRIVEKGREIHSEIVRLGLLESNTVLGNALVDMYGKCGVPEEAEQVFDSLFARDVVSWNTLITGHFKHGDDEKVLECFDQMQQEDLAPDAITFAYILKACGRVNAADIGIAIHIVILRNGLLESCTVLGSALLEMYVKCGSLAKAQQVFSNLKVRDVVLWTSLMIAYCEHGETEKVLECFENMQMEDLSPDAVTFACMLKVCGYIGAIDKGKEIHAEVITKGFLEENNLLGNALVDMYAKCGAFARAEEVFGELRTPDVVSWNAMVPGHAQLGHSEEVLNCPLQMKWEAFTLTLSPFPPRGDEVHKEIVKKGLLWGAVFNLGMLL